MDFGPCFVLTFSHESSPILFEALLFFLLLPISSRCLSYGRTRTTGSSLLLFFEILFLLPSFCILGLVLRAFPLFGSKVTPTIILHSETIHKLPLCVWYLTRPGQSPSRVIICIHPVLGWWWSTLLQPAAHAPLTGSRLVRFCLAQSRAPHTRANANRPLCFRRQQSPSVCFVDTFSVLSNSVILCTHSSSETMP